MENAGIWLTKLILAHLLTDFVLQPRQWVDERNRKHFLSGYLYLHGLITAIVAYIFIGRQYWNIALIILATHTLIDGWKSYRKETIVYFLTDQAMHLLVIAGCFYFTFLNPQDIVVFWKKIDSNSHFWILAAAFVFLTTPAGILIGQLTKRWREKIRDGNPENLANAGKWIGIIERVVILILVLHDQYGAIGLLVAAKGIVRFSEKDRPEIKTEYLLIGTLCSIGIAIITGVLIKAGQ